MNAALPACLQFIGGEFRPGAGAPWTLFDPATEETLGECRAADAADVDDAVAAAVAAQPQWAAIGPEARAWQLHRLACRMRERSTEIVAVEVRNTGNTIRRLGTDVELAARSLEYFAGLALHLPGDASSRGSGLHMAIREPFGVVARIVPFNHPFMFAGARMAAPLAAGNAVVIKTPETSPLSSMLLAELCRETLPAGVVNIVHGPGLPTGDALVRHARVKRIGFTGAVRTGLAIQRAAAESGVKQVSLELGGKNPLIVCPDVPVAVAAEAAVGGMNFGWAGQSCGSTSRVLVHSRHYGEVVAAIGARVAALRLGPPGERESDMGPVNSAGQLEKARHYIASARAQGARLVAGGARPDGAAFERGYWIQPTVFADVRPDMTIAREEVFGPVLSVLRWDTEEEALALANGVELGLTAAVWTNDLDRALRFARGLDAGYIWINGTSTHFMGMPFAGRRNSGTGSEETLEELLSYTESKAIHWLQHAPWERGSRPDGD